MSCEQENIHFVAVIRRQVYRGLLRFRRLGRKCKQADYPDRFVHENTLYQRIERDLRGLVMGLNRQKAIQVNPAVIRGLDRSSLILLDNRQASSRQSACGMRVENILFCAFFLWLLITFRVDRLNSLHDPSGYASYEANADYARL